MLCSKVGLLEERHKRPFAFGSFRVRGEELGSVKVYIYPYCRSMGGCKRWSAGGDFGEIEVVEWWREDAIPKRRRGWKQPTPLLRTWDRSIVKKNNVVRKYQGKRYSIAEALEASNDEHSIWVTVTEEIPYVSLQLRSIP
ncbi:hypothetical protein I7I51_01921 [Histoplasma capsulatum]|uniref:Uncharacterized protein n=1 Tax=Ajellomyces capsulatus TaxID=5037 RepID=A0A8A1ML98_AJECA|nr:hypothetical protein I7I51_01921 [Histoplasma capsulatum]